MTTIEILQHCTVKGNIVTLPQVQLDRKEYLEVKNKLELIGGKWKGGKTQGFVFEQDPTELLAAVANGDNRNLKQEYQFFPTPWKVRRMMIEKLFELNNTMKILEPSAGDGAIVEALVNEYELNRIDCFEIMELNRIKLCRIAEANLIGEDFLQCDLKDTYDVVVANPPFAKNQDIIHIAKMYEVCKPGGVIVTLASTSWTFGQQKLHTDFREWLNVLEAEEEEIEEGAFKESGTNVKTVLLKIVKPITTPVGLPELVLPKSKISAEKELKDIGDFVAAELDKEEKKELPAEPAYRSPQEILAEIKANDFEISKTLTELEQMLSPNNNDIMNFFQQLNDKLVGVELTIKIKRVGDKITVSALPNTTATMAPATLVGTAEEIDAGFFDAIKKPLEDAKGLQTHYESPAKKETAKESKKATEVKKKTPAQKEIKKEKPVVEEAQPMMFE